MLIVGGGDRGLELAGGLVCEGHAARIVTRAQERREAIERSGGECWVGDPDRLGTLRGALEGVTVACWLLGCATGSREALEALHGPRLRSFLGQAVDSTMRGFLYEAAGGVAEEILAEGERVAEEMASSNAIPLAVLRADPRGPGWNEAARHAVEDLLKADRGS